MKQLLFSSILTGFYILLTACSGSNGGGSSASIGDDDRRVIEQAEDRLSKHKINFNERKSRFEHPGLFTKVCQKNFAQDMELSWTEIVSVYAAIESGSAGYTGKNLEFFRKVKDMKESINDLAIPLKLFCDNDYEKLKSCVPGSKESDPIYLWANRPIGGYSLFHPLVRPNTDSPVALTVNQDQLKEPGQFKTIEIAKNEQYPKSPIDTIIRFTSEDQLEEIRNCMKDIELESSIGSLVAITITQSYLAATEKCKNRSRRDLYVEFCSPEPLPEMEDDSITKKPEFTAHYNALNEAAAVIEVLQKRYNALSKILEDHHHFKSGKGESALDILSDESKSNLLLRFKKAYGNEALDVIKSIETENNNLEKIIQNNPKLKDRTILLSSKYGTSGPDGEMIEKDRTLEVLLVLTRRSPLDDPRSDFFGKLLSIKKNVENIFSIDGPKLIKELNTEFDISIGDTETVFLQTQEIAQSLKVTDPKFNNTVLAPLEHEGIIEAILNY